MAEADWSEVTYIGKRQPKASQLKSRQAVNTAMRHGNTNVETTKKFNAGHNAQKSTDKNTAKLDRETEELHHEHVTLDTCKLIQQARQAKGISQKDLANKICEKPQVVNDYETGKAIPNQQILSKMERCLGVKLRGKDKGKPLGPK